MKTSAIGMASDVRGSSRLWLILLILLSPVTPLHAQAAQGQWTDWGGGYVRGPDSASITVATSGAGAHQPAPVAVPAAPTKMVPSTDWGGGYRRGPDSASTTAATSGAGTPKPDR